MVHVLRPPNISDDSNDFRQYLLSNGLNETTVQTLLDEEIEDLQTLRILSEDDIEKLNLKTGQKAKIRSLGRKQQNGVESKRFDSRKPTRGKGLPSLRKDDEKPRFVRCSPEVNGLDTTPSIKTVKRAAVTKNFTGILHVSPSSSSGKLLRMSIKHTFEIDVVWLLFSFDVLRILPKIK